MMEPVKRLYFFCKICIKELNRKITFLSHSINIKILKLEERKDVGVMNAIAGFVRKSDISLFYLFNKKIHSEVLDFLMKSITHLGSTTFSVLISIFLLVYPKQEVRGIGLQLIIALSSTQLIVQSIKRIVNRPRPYITLSDILPINPPACSYSFPSGHTCAAFSIALILSKNIPSLSLIFIPLALLVGVSRVYLGVHYPTDTVIGSLIAYGAFKIIFMLA